MKKNPLTPSPTLARAALQQAQILVRDAGHLTVPEHPAFWMIDKAMELLKDAEEALR